MTALSARDRANAQQLVASDPMVSAFVSASAGSGKTKLLTDRLLRLMLSGAEPGRIQCLTFTKAAAAEMALRLQRKLGGWVTMDDAALDAELEAIRIVPTTATRETARALFARVLDLAGGMRIGTIHAFCQSLLRRFPLEAELSPHFRLADEQDSAIAWHEARETMLSGAHTEARRAALESLAALSSLEGFGRLVQALHRDRARLGSAGGLDPATLTKRLRGVLGATTPGDVAAHADWVEVAELVRLFRGIADRGSAAAVVKALRILDWLALPLENRAENWDAWQEEFLTGGGEDRKLGAFLSAARQKDFPELEAIVTAEQARIRGVEDGWAAYRVAELSAALVSLAMPVTEAYAAGKAMTGRLDYDDLITRTAGLLHEPGAAWVLFKLDGGLDHLLLDEVQDTAPAQWQIAGSLTSEFFSGDGAREGRRTIFAVGDRKQSIYGFQGADPDAFEQWRGLLRGRVQDSGAEWRDVSLDVSFRSTAPVLALVDAVFGQPAAAVGVAEEALSHQADRADQAGRVELWPITPKPEPEAVDVWSAPTRNVRQASAMQRLADALAEWIDRRIADGMRLESRDRVLGAGDILVLVRRRNAFAAALVRALKIRGVPVAGLDRMVLTEQPAVADLMALCDVLLLPEDDLSLACVLTSPLGGLSDDELMALAAGRTGSLFQALLESRDACCGAARDFVLALLSRVDYAAPHALLCEALGPLGGRARLLARLGPEAAEPIDELLAASLRHAQSHPAALQGFLHWLRQSAAEVKREPEGPSGAGHGFDAVRIMTVHGAKGLQAPVVILPDTTGLPPDDETIFWAPDGEGGEIPVWSPREAVRCEQARLLRQAATGRQAAEQNRLLYVALTRAEDHLLVCGWQVGAELRETSWYAHVRRGFEALEAESAGFAAVGEPWEGAHRWCASAQVGPVARAVITDAPGVSALPRWAGAAPGWQPVPLPVEPALPSPLAPSRPEGAWLGTVPEAASPLARAQAGDDRFRRGVLVHSLLQHLPDLDADERAEAAAAFLARAGLVDADVLAAEVVGVLDHPALSPLFGPLGQAEVPITGVVSGRVVGGMIDRLVVLSDRVILCDYKTNRAPPAAADRVPVLYLRQMAAYRAVLAEIHPDRPIDCLLVWTVGAQVMALPGALLDGHAPAAEAHA